MLCVSLPNRHNPFQRMNHLSKLHRHVQHPQWKENVKFLILWSWMSVVWPCSSLHHSLFYKWGLSGRTAPFVGLRWWTKLNDSSNQIGSIVKIHRSNYWGVNVKTKSHVVFVPSRGRIVMFIRISGANSQATLNSRLLSKTDFHPSFFAPEENPTFSHYSHYFHLPYYQQLTPQHRVFIHSFRSFGRVLTNTYIHPKTT